MADGSKQQLLEYHDGVHLKDTLLWMDARRPRPLCFVSHANVPDALVHQKIVSTALTAELLRARAAAYGRGRRAHEPQALITPYGRPFLLGQLSLELFPSGSLLGAASLLVKHQGQSVVYAGDISLRRSPLVEALEARPCDLLALPARFGERRYVFPPAKDTAEALLAYVGDAVAAGRSVVLLCPELGEAQEVAHLLLEAELPVMAHRRVATLCRVYREAGMPLGPVPQYRRGDGPVALLWPVDLRHSAVLKRLQGARTVLVSGRALDPQTRHEMGCDAAFALSCHADYSAVLEYVRACAPSRVVLVGGRPAHLLKDLRGLGLEVSMLGPREQMKLF